MPTQTETSDAALLDLVQKQGPLTVPQMASATSVTATAVRQRLSRLLGQGLVQREVQRSQGRGRPVHRYSITEKARRKNGSNFADLALVLWEALKSVPNPEVRRGLLQRIAKQFGNHYAAAVTGNSTKERLDSLADLFAQRSVPVSVSRKPENGLQVLTVHECPYPDLAEKDRGICAVEKMMFSQLVGDPMCLTECRLDGHDCCQFETK